MTTRSRVFIVGAAGVLICLVAWVMLSESSQDQDDVIVTFVGPGIGPPQKTAAFGITNQGKRSILLRGIRVQVASSKGAWNSLPETSINISPVLEPGASQINYSPVVDPKDHRTILVDWPAEDRWRVCLIYHRENGGVDALQSRARMFLRTATFPPSRTQSWQSTSRHAYSRSVPHPD